MVPVGNDRPYRIWAGEAGATVTIQNNDAANDVKISVDPTQFINVVPGTLPANGLLIAHGGGSYVYPNAPNTIYARSAVALKLTVEGRSPGRG